MPLPRIFLAGLIVLCVGCQPFVRRDGVIRPLHPDKQFSLQLPTSDIRGFSKSNPRVFMLKVYPTPYCGVCLMWGDGRRFSSSFQAFPSRKELETINGDAGRWTLQGEDLTIETVGFDSEGRRFVTGKGYMTGNGFVITSCYYTDSPEKKSLIHDVYEEIDVGAVSRIHDW